jgi:hypothetical protein
MRILNIDGDDRRLEVCASGQSVSLVALARTRNGQYRPEQQLTVPRASWEAILAAIQAELVK